ncbi:MAG TPA: serine/threonine-protein kinase [Polyangiales bacterium]|nr:serine/threonine-protein kinase [Polyangiales bacterium]
MNTTLPQSGEVFDFRYRIICRLGFGPDGYVFGATELDTGKRVAIKCWVGPHAEQSLAASQQFVRTAHEVRLFDNPHIVEVFAAEAGRTVNYCVMDWLEGMTLARRIARRRPSPLSDVFNIVVPCMRAVAEAHAAGIVHGDIRPGHIYICQATKHRPAIARVFDFGRNPADAAHSPDAARPTNAEINHYATPEGLQGAALDARSDTYAFGVILFEMLAGERPFFADTQEELARKIKDGEAKLLASISHAIPVRLANVVERAMSVDPALRYANLGELIDALAPFDPGSAYVYYTPPSRPRPPSTSTALALRGHNEPPRVVMPPPPPPRPRATRQVVHRTPAHEVSDITTTSASWELTEPVPLGHYRFELLGRITWQRAALWVSVLLSAVITARYVQDSPAAETTTQAATALPEAPLDLTPPPTSGFDPITCRNGFGMLDPTCAPPLKPVPEKILPIGAPPEILKVRGNASPTPPAATPTAQRAAPAARLSSLRRAISKTAPAVRSKHVSHKKPIEPASKRPRNTDAHTNDPFERLDNMRLQ